MCGHLFRLSTPTLFVRIPVTVLGSHEHSIILNQNTKLSRNSVTQSIRLTLLFFAGHRFSINQDTTHSLPPCLLSVMCTTKVGRKCAIFYKCTSALHVPPSLNAPCLLLLRRQFQTHGHREHRTVPAQAYRASIRGGNHKPTSVVRGVQVILTLNWPTVSAYIGQMPVHRHVCQVAVLRRRASKHVSEGLNVAAGRQTRGRLTSP